MRGVDPSLGVADTVVLFTNSTMMGGMEAHIAVLGRGYRERGMHVVLVCPDDELVAPLRQDMTAAGVEVVSLGSQARSLLGLARRFWTLLRLFRRCRPFLLHLHITGSDGGALPMAAAKLAGARAIVRTEHQPPDYPVSLRKRVLIRLRDRFLSALICVSNANLEQHVRDLRRDRSKFTAIHNCVNLEAFDPARADPNALRTRLGMAEGTLVVGTLGRLAEPRKGVEFFVDMARKLAPGFPSVRFVVSGDGPRRQALEERADGTVSFIGFYPSASEFYAGLDIFVMPSLWEGGPITVIEAMAMGKPVVATDVGMVSEVIRSGDNGVIVPPGDADALVEAVRFLIDNPEEANRMAKRARETVDGEFTPELMVERVLAVYAASIK